MLTYDERRKGCPSRDRAVNGMDTRIAGAHTVAFARHAGRKAGSGGMAGRHMGASRHSPRIARVNGVRLMLGMMIAIGIMSIVTMCVGRGYDNDIWFILATGRQIAEHGIPYTNPFSVYPGMAFVAQQWLVCLVDWRVWSAFGFVGLGAVLLAECAALILAMRSAMLSASGTRRIGIGAMLLMLMTMSAACSYISFRPQILTMTLMTLTISVMERYRKTGDARRLAWLLPITALHANVHMSMMWMDIAIVCCYAMPPARCVNRLLAAAHSAYVRVAAALGDVELGTMTDGRMHASPWRVQFVEDGYPRVPVLVSIAMMLAATCANPYGLSGSTYLFASYGAAGYGNYISEMNKVTPMGAPYGMALTACIVIAAIAIGRRGIRRMDMPMLLMALGTIPVSLANIRSVWILPIITLPFATKTLCSARHRDVTDRIGTFPLLRNMIVAVTVVLCATLAVVGMQSLAKEQYTDNANTPIRAMDTLDGMYADEDARRDVKICTMFNLGGFVEYHGYSVSMDPRPETWQDAISHDGNDHYVTYVDAINDTTAAKEMLDSCDFDYVLVSSGATLRQVAQQDGYTLLTSGNGYVLLQRPQ